PAEIAKAVNLPIGRRSFSHGVSYLAPRALLTFVYAEFAVWHETCSFLDRTSNVRQLTNRRGNSMGTKATAMTLVAVLALGMLAIPGTASAAKAQQAPGAANQCGAKIRLQATPAGQALAAAGNASKRVSKGRQVFVVEVNGLIPAGTVFAVFVNGTTL